MKINVSLLISGKLGFLVLKKLMNFCVIEHIATDKNSLDIITFANKYKIPLFIGNPRKGKLATFIKDNKTKILLSINYLFLIEEDVISKFEFPINFHGSLLPKYRGRTPHVWAIINNEKKTGITAHFIDKDCDSGDILLQRGVDILEDDTGGSILEKFFELYPKMVVEVILQLDTKSYKRVKQNNNDATFYDKRTPVDGKIDWNWHKDRIRNWVRAQAQPYPGSFTYFNGERIIIDKISYSNQGFNNDMPNGMVIKCNPKPIIKTPNGAVVLEEVRDKNIRFVKNKILK